MIVGKIWGTTEPELIRPLFEAHRLVIKPKSQCSLHVHHRKANAFHVVKGRLFIDVVKNDYALTDTTELGPGDWADVQPGEYHRFRTGDEPCEAFEMYYTGVLSDDIQRKDHGGQIRKNTGKAGGKVRKGTRR